jgi:hypothetical protein
LQFWTLLSTHQPQPNVGLHDLILLVLKKRRRRRKGWDRRIPYLAEHCLGKKFESCDFVRPTHGQMRRQKRYPPIT